MDLDCFYAQVEAVRLKLNSEATPLAVQQWNGLIAVNYKAREKNIQRFDKIREAQQKAPDLRLVHVALYKKGETNYQYYDNQKLSPEDYKVSLDPYRIESKKILAICQQMFPNGVEKASIDEVYIDCSFASQIQFDFCGSAQLEGVKLLNHTLTDIAEEYLVAGNMAKQLSQKIFKDLGYTVSIGVSLNKLLAKLCSSHNKPNCVSMLVPGSLEDVHQFLNPLKVKKVRGLGGKIGDSLEAVGVLTLVQLRALPSERLLQVLDAKQVSYVKQVLDGVCEEPINPRLNNKSFLSAKSLMMKSVHQGRKPVTEVDDVLQWLIVLCAEVTNRCLDEYELNSRWPSQIQVNVTFQNGNQSSVSPQTAFKIDDMVDHEEFDDDDAKLPSLSNSAGYTKTVPAPHPSNIRQKIFKLLADLLLKDFPQQKNLQYGTHFQWIGVKAQAFTQLQKSNIMTFFKKSTGTDYIVNEQQRQSSSSSSTKSVVPIADLRSYSSQPTQQEPLGDEDVETYDLTVAQDDQISLGLLDFTENLPSDQDSEVDEQYRLIRCDLCGDDIVAIGWEEHKDFHAAQELQGIEREKRRKHIQAEHDAKVSRLHSNKKRRKLN